MEIKTAIILAGGKSSRMGFDKQEIKIQGKYIGTYQGDILKEEFDEIILVSNRPELYKDRDFKIIEDIYPGYGPLSGLHAGLMASKSQAVFLIACDMPNIELSYIRYIKELAKSTGRGVVTEVDGYIEPMYGIYPKYLLDEIDNILKNNLDPKIKNIIRPKGFNIVSQERMEEITQGLDIFKNLNTKEDLNYFNYKAGKI